MQRQFRVWIWCGLPSLSGALVPASWIFPLFAFSNCFLGFIFVLHFSLVYFWSQHSEMLMLLLLIVFSGYFHCLGHKQLYRAKHHANEYQNQCSDSFYKTATHSLPLPDYLHGNEISPQLKWLWREVVSQNFYEDHVWFTSWFIWSQKTTQYSIWRSSYYAQIRQLSMLLGHHWLRQNLQTSRHTSTIVRGLVKGINMTNECCHSRGLSSVDNVVIRISSRNLVLIRRHWWFFLTHRYFMMTSLVKLIII